MNHKGHVVIQADDFVNKQSRCLCLTCEVFLQYDENLLLQARHISPFVEKEKCFDDDFSMISRWYR